MGIIEKDFGYDSNLFYVSECRGYLLIIITQIKISK